MNLTRSVFSINFFLFAFCVATFLVLNTEIGTGLVPYQENGTVDKECARVMNKGERIKYGNNKEDRKEKIISSL